MDTKPESTETQETQPMDQTEKLSPTGISAMQGTTPEVKTTDVPPPPEKPADEKPPEPVTPPPTPKVPDHPPYKPGYAGETLPMTEGEPLDEKSNREGPIVPPKDWRPGGIEGGG